KELILAMQAMAFDKMEKELGAIVKMVNNREVSRVKGVLEDLKKNAQRITALVDRENSVLVKIKSAEQKMEKMALSMEGVLRRAASIRIFGGAVADAAQQQPALLIDSDKKKDTLVKIQGSYSAEKGFAIVRV
ncbi:MAG: hypothetical protein R6V54_02325, partial [Desulfobacteraceae bacterium]